MYVCIYYKSKQMSIFIFFCMSSKKCYFCVCVCVWEYIQTKIFINKSVAP